MLIFIGFPFSNIHTSYCFAGGWTDEPAGGIGGSKLCERGEPGCACIIYLFAHCCVGGSDGGGGGDALFLCVCVLLLLALCVCVLL